VTRIRREGCPVAVLAESLSEVAVRYPSTRLVRSQVGNLCIIDAGEQVGWVDLTSGDWQDYRAGEATEGT
jgi:hypothetical protein